MKKVKRKVKKKSPKKKTDVYAEVGRTLWPTPAFERPVPSEMNRDLVYSEIGELK